MTKRKPTPAEAKALAFAWRAVKHVKSNAIVLTNERQTVGIGARADESSRFSKNCD